MFKFQLFKENLLKIVFQKIRNVQLKKGHRTKVDIIEKFLLFCLSHEVRESLIKKFVTENYIKVRFPAIKKSPIVRGGIKVKNTL